MIMKKDQHQKPTVSHIPRQIVLRGPIWCKWMNYHGKYILKDFPLVHNLSQLNKEIVLHIMSKCAPTFNHRIGIWPHFRWTFHSLTYRCGGGGGYIEAQRLLWLGKGSHKVVCQGFSHSEASPTSPNVGIWSL